jgi:hypothetical protein
MAFIGKFKVIQYGLPEFVWNSDPNPIVEQALDRGKPFTSGESSHV